MPRLSIAVDPFANLAESTVTSNHIDLRDAFDFRLSWRTTSGSVSTFTYQVNNQAGGLFGNDLTEAGWQDAFSVAVSASSFTAPPLGVRWARIVRTVSGASLTFEGNKQVLS